MAYIVLHSVLRSCTAMSVRNGTLTIEMRVLIVEKNTLKSCQTLIFLLNPTASISVHSSEILYILVAQETAKLPNVKV